MARFSLITVLTAFAGLVFASPAGAQVSVEAKQANRVDVRGDSILRWSDTPDEYYILEGRCHLHAAEGTLASDRMVLRVVRQANSALWRVTVAAEGNVHANGQLVASPYRSQWTVETEPTIDAPQYRGLAASRPAQLEILAPRLVAPVQFTPLPDTSGLIDSGSTTAMMQGSALPQNPQLDLQPVIGPDEPLMPAQPTAGSGRFQLILGGGSRSIEIVSRGTASSAQIETQNRPEVGETVVVARGGVTILIRDVQAEMPGGERLDLGTVSLSADKIVGWLPIVTGLFSGDNTLDQAEGEFYLEGNIVFRQGERIVYADSMYYNVTRQYGMILSAEAITPVPEYDGLVRLKADVLQQVSSGEFIAFDAAVTTSRIGIPRYWLQSEQLRFSDQTKAGIDPVTGAPVEISDRVLSGAGSFVYLGGVPVLYWPTFSSDVTVPSFYVTGVKLKSDSVFGTQVFVDSDLFQLLGIDKPPAGVRWTLSTDYLSKRGPAIGTAVTYNRPSFLGLPGPASGFIDAYGIYDTGLDILGQDRIDIPPEREFRGRVLGRHRQFLPNDYELIAEIGQLSDRNFLEEYFENEYDRDKDHDTNLRLRKYYYNNLFDLSVVGHPNKFYTETQRLPSLDHYMLGSSILGDRLTWSMHNQISYSELGVATIPKDPQQEAITQTPLPGEVDAVGVIGATKQEISMPFELGPVKMAPFVSGEASYYGQDASLQDLTRLLGQAGLRASLPMWRVDPNVQSSLLNVRGLAHKAELSGELFYADSNTNLDELPLYDPLDDDSQVQFRRRFFFNTFGGSLPTPFDTRNYALRQGMQRLVTNPSEIIADDLIQARLGVHQRWQTKRGAPGRERIVDLMRLDVDTILFPDSDRDNFGETVGPTTYDFRYYFGDRVTLLSDGYADFFEDGLRSVSVGLRTSRPGVGDVYAGLMSLEGPVSSFVLRTTYDYRLNEKWIFTAGNMTDFGDVGNVSQNAAVTRIGESMLIRMGIDYDKGRDNVGLFFLVEPRFWPGRTLGNLGGMLLPPPGAEGLE